jgi:hypothetical protein
MKAPAPALMNCLAQLIISIRPGTARAGRQALRKTTGLAAAMLRTCLALAMSLGRDGPL